MAIDTRDKRASILGLGLATLLVLPTPGGAIDSGDRQQTTDCYRGVAAAEPITVILQPSQCDVFRAKAEPPMAMALEEAPMMAVAGASPILTAPEEPPTLTAPTDDPILTIGDCR
jgi:hypothetical protein